MISDVNGFSVKWNRLTCEDDIRGASGSRMHHASWTTGRFNVVRFRFSFLNCLLRNYFGH